MNLQNIQNIKNAKGAIFTKYIMRTIHDNVILLHKNKIKLLRIK